MCMSDFDSHHYLLQKYINTNMFLFFLKDQYVIFYCKVRVFKLMRYTFFLKEAYVLHYNYNITIAPTKCIKLFFYFYKIHFYHLAFF